MVRRVVTILITAAFLGSTVVGCGETLLRAVATCYAPTSPRIPKKKRLPEPDGEDGLFLDFYVFAGPFVFDRVRCVDVGKVVVPRAATDAILITVDCDDLRHLR